MARPFNTTQPLGKIMFAQRWSVTEMSAASSINARTLSDYLAGRRIISERHLMDLADVLDVDPADLIPDPII